MSLLNKELTLKIRPLILKGVNYIDIQNQLGIKSGTWDYWYWDNYMIDNGHQGFRDFVKSCKYERMMNSVNSNLEEFLNLDDLREDGKKDAALAKLKQDTTKFVAETLGKVDFSKHSTSDVTSNGEKIQFVLNSELSERDNIENHDFSQNTKDSSTEQEEI